MKKIDPKDCFKIGEWNELHGEQLQPAQVSVRWKLSEDGKTAEVEEVWDTNHPECPFSVIHR